MSASSSEATKSYTVDDLLSADDIQVDGSLSLEIELGALMALASLPFEIIPSLLHSHYHPDEKDHALPLFTPGFSLGSSLTSSSSPLAVSRACDVCGLGFPSWSALFSHQPKCAGPSSPSSAAPAAAAPAKAETWTCGQCTLENATSVDICTVCSGPRDTESFWCCPQCTFTNIMLSETCEVCEAPKVVPDAAPSNAAPAAHTAAPSTPTPATPTAASTDDTPSKQLARIKTFLLASSFHAQLLDAVLSDQTLTDIRLLCLTLLAGVSEHGNASTFFSLVQRPDGVRELVARNLHTAKIANQTRDFVENVLFAALKAGDVADPAALLESLLQHVDSLCQQLLSPDVFHELWELVMFVMTQLEERQPGRLPSLGCTALLPLLGGLAGRIAQLKSSDDSVADGERRLRACGVLENLADYTYFEPLPSAMSFADWHDGANLLEQSQLPSLPATVVACQNIAIDAQRSSAALLRFYAAPSSGRASATISLDLSQRCRVGSFVLVFGPSHRPLDVSVAWSTSLSEPAPPSSAGKNAPANVRDGHPRQIVCGKLARYLTIEIAQLGAASATLQLAVFGHASPPRPSAESMLSGAAAAETRRCFDAARLQISPLRAAVDQCRRDLLAALHTVTGSGQSTLPDVAARRLRALRREKQALTFAVRQYRFALDTLLTLQRLHNSAHDTVDDVPAALWCANDRLQSIFCSLCRSLPENSLDSTALFSAAVTPHDPAPAALVDLFGDVIQCNPRAVAPLAELLHNFVTPKRWPSFPHDLLLRCFAAPVDAKTLDAFRSMFALLAGAHAAPSDLFTHRLLTDLVRFLDSDQCTNPHLCAATLGCLSALVVDNQAALVKPSIHQGSRCGNCQMMPIAGVRYHCAQCLDFSLCADCFARFAKQRSPAVDHCLDHSFLVIPRPLPLPPASKLSVAAVKILSQPLLSRSLYAPRATAAAASSSSTSAVCSRCSDSLLGLHYKCANCPDYVVCGRCQTQADNAPHFPLHVMMALTRPMHVAAPSGASVKPNPQALIGSQSTIPLLLSQKLYPQLVRQALRLRNIEQQTRQSKQSGARPTTPSGRSLLTRSLDSAAALRHGITVGATSRAGERASLLRSAGGVDSVFSKSDGHAPLAVDELALTEIEGRPLSVIFASFHKLLSSSPPPVHLVTGVAKLLTALAKLFSPDEISSDVVLHPDAQTFLRTAALLSDSCAQQEILAMFADILSLNESITRSSDSQPALKLLELIFELIRATPGRKGLLFYAQLVGVCLHSLAARQHADHADLATRAYLLLELFERLPLTSLADLSVAAVLLDALALLPELPSSAAFVALFAAVVHRLVAVPVKYQPTVVDAAAALIDRVLRAEPTAFLVHAVDAVCHSAAAASPTVGRVTTKLVSLLARYVADVAGRKTELSRLDLPASVLAKLLGFVAARLPPVVSLSVVDLDRYWSVDPDQHSSSTGYQLLPAVCDALTALLDVYRHAEQLRPRLLHDVAADEASQLLEPLVDWYSSASDACGFAVDGLPVASSLADLLAACLACTAPDFHAGAVRATANVFRRRSASPGLRKLLVAQFNRWPAAGAAFYLSPGVADLLLRDTDTDSDADADAACASSVRHVDLTAGVESPGALAAVLEQPNAAAAVRIAGRASFELGFGQPALVHEVRLQFEIRTTQLHSQSGFAVLSSLPAALLVYAEGLPVGSASFDGQRVDTVPKTVSVRVKLESPRRSAALRLAFEQAPGSVALLSHVRCVQALPQPGWRHGLLPLLAACLHQPASCQHLVARLAASPRLHASLWSLLELEDAQAFEHVHVVFAALAAADNGALLVAVFERLLACATQPHHARLASALCAVRAPASVQAQRLALLQSFTAQLLLNRPRAMAQGELLAGFVDCLTELVHRHDDASVERATLQQAMAVCRCKSVCTALRRSLFALVSAALQRDGSAAEQLAADTAASLQRGGDADDLLQLELFGAMASASEDVARRLLDSSVLETARRLLREPGTPPVLHTALYKLFAQLVQAPLCRDWLVSNLFDYVFETLARCEPAALAHVEEMFVAASSLPGAAALSTTVFDRLLAFILGAGEGVIDQSNPYVRMFLKVMAAKESALVTFRRCSDSALTPVEPVRSLAWQTGAEQRCTLLHDGRTVRASDASDDSPVTVRTADGFSSGVHRWRVSLRTSPQTRTVTVGFVGDAQHSGAAIAAQAGDGNAAAVCLSRGGQHGGVQYRGVRSVLPAELQLHGVDELEFTLDLDGGSLSVRHNDALLPDVLRFAVDGAVLYPAVTFHNATDTARIDWLSSQSTGPSTRLHAPLLYHVSPGDVAFLAPLETRVRELFARLHYAELALDGVVDAEQTVGELLPHSGRLTLRYRPAGSVREKNRALLRQSAETRASEPAEAVIFSAFSNRLAVLTRALDARHRLVTGPGALWRCYAQWFDLIDAALKVDGFGAAFSASTACRDRLFELFRRPSYHELAAGADRLAAEAAVLQPLLAVIVAFVHSRACLPSADQQALLLAFMNCMAYLTHTEHRRPQRFLSPEDLARLQQQQQQADAAKTSHSSDADRDVVWASGVGYGHGDRDDGGERWDSAATARALAERNRMVSSLLGLVVSSAVSDEATQLLADSCLVPVLMACLRNDSLFDMMQDIDYTRSVLGLVSSIAASPQLLPLFDIADGAATVPALLFALERNAKQAIETIRLVEKSAAADDDAKADQSDELDFAQYIVSTAAAVHSAIDAPKQAASSSSSAAASSSSAASSSASSSAASSSASSSNVDEEQYRAALQDLQFGTADVLKQQHTFHYASALASSGKMSQRKMRRIIRELSSLQTSLPLAPACSIFVRVDSSRTDCLQCLITGPLGTPYGGGCFVFDIFLDQDYPNASPKVNLETTGNGSVRFNPNLYNCGKVCLSLLGTWQGASNESWDPNHSTLLQVLVSIQSLILVDEPYFNEPGYESRSDEDDSKAKSRRYNSCIRVVAVRWAMVNQIVNPAEDFAPVIHRHFALAKQPIVEQIARWLDLSEPSERQQLLDAAADFVRAVEAIPPIDGVETKPLVVPPVIQEAYDKIDWTTRSLAQWDDEINTDIYSF